MHIYYSNKTCRADTETIDFYYKTKRSKLAQRSNVHPFADVQTKNIGSSTTVGQFAIILPGAVIGENCRIGTHLFIENDVILGNNVILNSGSCLWDGLRIEDDVTIGPSVTFVNDKYPRSKRYPKKFPITTLGKGASIGANAVIMAGITVGQYAVVGAGSVVTKDVPEYTLVYGNPAFPKAMVNKNGTVIKDVRGDDKSNTA